MPQLTKTLILEQPIEWDGTMKNELELRELTAGQLQEVESLGLKNRVEHALKLMSLSCGLPPPALKGLLARDYNRATDFILSFLSDAPLAGAAS